MGIQGSLMSYFTSPIYFSSIILGSLYHADHLSRAMYQRIADIEDLPQQFTLNRPLLSGQYRLQCAVKIRVLCGMNEAEAHNERRITEAEKQFKKKKKTSTKQSFWGKKDPRAYQPIQWEQHHPAGGWMLLLLLLLSGCSLNGG